MGIIHICGAINRNDIQGRPDQEAIIAGAMKGGLGAPFTMYELLYQA